MATALFLVLELGRPPGLTVPRIAEALAVAALLAGTTSLGLLVVLRTGNGVGWLLCLIGFNYAWGGLGEIRMGSVADPASDPVLVIEAWLGDVLWIPGLLLLPLVILLFPDGRLPSRRWRPVAWLGAGAAVLAVVSGLLEPEIFDGVERFGRQVPAPLAGLVPAEVLGALELAGSILLIPFLVACLASPAVRYRRSVGEERLQLRWFAWGAAVALVGTILFTVLWYEEAPVLLTVVTLLALPVSITVAIFRYRLYDIDLVINRPLVYGSLTGFLGLVYVGGVVGLSQLLPVEGNDLAVAGSTLAVAALFSPARRRIQAFVDRRFYRSRYHARRTVEEFSSRLRHQVDLDLLLGDLQGVVRDTLAPVAVGVWLRRVEDEGGREVLPRAARPPATSRAG